MDKHYSSLGTIVNYSREKFYSIAPLTNKKHLVFVCGKAIAFFIVRTNTLAYFISP